ncbi:MAG: AAA domain-containing protein [Polyangiaceae bacterium]
MPTLAGSPLDGPTLRWALACELAHLVAHGDGRSSLELAEAVLRSESAPSLREAAATYRLSCALTVDRIAAKVADLRAAATLDVVDFTGLPAADLTWEVDAHLELCRDSVTRFLRQEAPSPRELPVGLALRPFARFSDESIRLLQSDTTGVSRTALPVSTVLSDVDPALIHEAALAASVLVASADDPLDDAEIDSIEHTFSPLLDDVSPLLDIEVSRQRLRAALPLLTRLGASSQRTLATLVLHTITRAGDVHPRELSMLDGIGDALGGQLVRTMATIAARHLPGRILASPGAFTPAQPALGGASGGANEGLAPIEGDAALEVFLRSFQRRGGETTLRQMLLLIGAVGRSSAPIARVNEALRQSGLRTSSDLATVDLDEPVVLVRRVDQTLPPDEPSESVVAQRAKGTDGPIARVLDALEQLREGLISGDGRSPSIRAHQAKPGRIFDLVSLDALTIGRAERTLTQILAGNNASLVEPVEAGTTDQGRNLSLSLLTLDRESRARFEETGARDLHLGHTFLIGNVDGYFIRAPLVLVPVELTRVDRGARGFVAKTRDASPAFVNPALLRALFARKDFSLSDELADRLDDLAAAANTDALLDELITAGLPIKKRVGPLSSLADRREQVALWPTNRIELEACATLGLYPLASSEVLHDLDDLIAVIRRDPARTAERLGTAIELFPKVVQQALGQPDSLPPTPGTQAILPAISLDPSQQRVLERARGERMLVVDGPPGSGKSQLIVALVCDALSRKERVAVVSDKRAALDVVARRLHQLGLNDSTMLVHDVYEDRTSTYEKIARRLELDHERSHDTRALNQATDDVRELTELLETRQRALGAQLPSGSAAPRTLGNLHALTSSLPIHPQLASLALPSLAQVSDADLPQLVQGLSALRPFADLFVSSSPWAAKRSSFAHSTPDQRAAQANQIEAALTSAQAFEHVWTATGNAPLEPIIAAKGAITAARATRDMRSSPRAQEIFSAALTLILANPDRAPSINAAEQTWNTARPALEKLSTRMSVELGSKVEEHLQTLLQWQSRWPRFLSVGWWEAERATRAALSTAWPERAKSPFTRETIEEIQAAVVATRAWRAADAALEALNLRASTPDTVEDTGKTLAEVAAAARSAAALIAARPLLSAASAWPDPPSVEAIAAWDRWLDTLTQAVAAADARRTAIEPIRAIFPWLSTNASASELESLLKTWARDATRVAEADRLLASISALHRDAPASVAAISNASMVTDAQVPPPSLADWQNAITRAWALARIAEIERIAPDVRALDHATRRGDETTVIHTLQSTIARAIELTREAMWTSVDHVVRSNVPSGNSRDELLRECRKQRRRLPMRALVRRFVHSGLLDAAPVWLLSPETMTVLFPQAPIFDRVIFDEASQCTVENGLPVLVRGKHAVVVGDEQQMPPSFFFVARNQDDEESSEGRPVDTLVEATAPRSNTSAESKETIFDPPSESPSAESFLAAESLLSLARARVPHVGLSWHYRCFDESLIAFSNQAFYAGSLLTIPASTKHTEPAIRWIPVANAKLERGRNELEARAIVDEIARLLERPETPSIGVVTLNVQQRQAILDELDRRVERDEAFASVWRRVSSAETLDERPFVKNIENVQGDERDVILFSTGHAPVERKRRSPSAPIELYVPARFGPIGQQGGERRLNVAISRARRELIVVASFEPHQLSVAHSQHDGPRLFKLFLSYAFHTARNDSAIAAQTLMLARRGSSTPPRLSKRAGHIPLAIQIATRLRAEGHDCEVDVGSSDFKLPLVITPAGSLPRVAVLTDEGDDRLDVLEKLAHRPTLLGQRGWRVERVTARQWARDPSAVMAQLLRVII